MSLTIKTKKVENGSYLIIVNKQTKYLVSRQPEGGWLAVDKEFNHVHYGSKKRDVIDEIARIEFKQFLEQK